MIQEAKLVLEKILPEIVDPLELAVFELNVGIHDRTLHIEVIVDHSRGGVTIAECTRVHRELIDQIEEANLIDMPFSLQVNSPGLDRPLRNQMDFERVQGRVVRFYLAEKWKGSLEHVGTIASVGHEDVTVESGKNSLKIPYRIINKAIQEIVV